MQIEPAEPRPSPADVMPNASAFVRFLNAISLTLILVGGIWLFVNVNALAEIVFGIGAGLMVVSTFGLVMAVKAHNARLKRAEGRETIVRAGQGPNDAN